MKKLISILLVLIVLVNAVGFGFLNVRSSASPLGYAIWEVAKDFAIGIIGGAAGQAAYGTGEAVGELSSQWHLNQIQNDLENDSLVSADVDETGLLTFYVSSNCSSESAEFASILCSELNSLNEMERRPNLYGSYNITADSYKNVKNKCMNAYIDYINAQAQAEAASGLGDTLSELGAVTTPFDFTGPLQPSLTLPSSSGAVSLNLNGFTFLTPSKYTSTGYQTESEALAHGDTAYEGSRGYWPKVNRTCYGTFYYAIYGGEVYYAVGDTTLGYSNYDRDVFVSNYGGFKNSSGQTLDSVPGYNMWDDSFLNALSVGVGIYTDQSSAGYLPYEYTYSANDFTEVIPGDTVGFERTPEEELIGDLMGLEGLGIVNSTNPTLTIDPTTGQITAVDGIEVATLQTLVREVKELQAENVDLTGIESLLEQIRDNTADIADINAALQEIAGSIAAAQEITAEKDFDIDTPDTIIDKFPFSLPFDIYNTFNLLSAQPVAPRFTFPLKMEGVFDYSFSVDLSEYDWIADIVRWLLYVVFIVGLILATNKLIGRG